MGRVGRGRVVGGLFAGLLLAGVVATASPVGAKLQKACTVLDSAEIEDVLGLPIGDPDGSGSGAGCGFDIGEGVGSPAGGLVVMQYQKGVVAKGIWSAAKKEQEQVGKLYWDDQYGIASGFKNGKLIAASVSITGTDDLEHRDDALALVTEALKNV